MGRRVRQRPVPCHAGRRHAAPTPTHRRLRHNGLGERTRLTHDEVLPAGAISIEVTFTKSGPLAGEFALAVDGRQVARSGPLRTAAVPLGADFAIGADDGSPVGTGYAPPFPFPGRIGDVEVHLGDDVQPVTLPDLLD